MWRGRRDWRPLLPGFRQHGLHLQQPARQEEVRKREWAAEVRRSLDNYQKLKQAIENICELNHELLRSESYRRGVRCRTPGSFLAALLTGSIQMVLVPVVGALPRSG